MMPSRGRLIVALLLSALVLLTLDSRGNAAFDAARSSFGVVTRPISSGVDVIASPFRNVWAAMTEVDDIRDENDELRDQLAGAEADLIAAENAIRQANELRQTLRIDSLGQYPRVTGDIIGDSPSNFEQRVEINRGTNDGIRDGMPVIGGGLIGKITKAGPTSSEVMLISDIDYAVRVKVVASTESGTEETVPATTPSGIPLNSIDEAVAAATTSTTEPESVIPEGTEEPSAPAGLPSEQTDTASSAVPTAPSTTTASTVPESTAPSATTVPESTAPPRPRETGALHGNGPDRLPSISFAENFSEIQVGDLVLTTGGSKSLAPPEIPIGRVANIIEDAGIDGVQVEVELTADLERLNFLTVLLYRPPTELTSE